MIMIGKSIRTTACLEVTRVFSKMALFNILSAPFYASISQISLVLSKGESAACS